MTLEVYMGFGFILGFGLCYDSMHIYKKDIFLWTWVLWEAAGWGPLRAPLMVAHRGRKDPNG